MSLREELDAVRAQFGKLTPATVVEAARPEESPLHNRFEWDDAAAATAYRVVQARELIRIVRITYIDGTGNPADARAFVSINRPETPDREYIPTEEVAANPLLRQMVLRDAEREWRTLKMKYEHLDEFMSLIRDDVAA